MNQQREDRHSSHTQIPEYSVQRKARTEGEEKERRGRAEKEQRKSRGRAEEEQRER